MEQLKIETDATNETNQENKFISLCTVLIHLYGYSARKKPCN